jgi:hypothetical protein
MTEILRHLTWTIPKVSEQQPLPVVCYGDALTVQRISDAKNGAAQAEDAVTRLEAFVQAPQDFHRRGKLLQMTFEEFFKVRKLFCAIQVLGSYRPNRERVQLREVPCTR